jgi:hypothetical protein
MKTRSAYNPTSITKAYYTLNGNSNDTSGQNSGGTNTAITYPQGKFGQAAKFDGSTSTINFGNVLNYNYNDSRTFSFWLNPINFTGLQAYLWKKDTAGNFVGWGIQNISGAGKINYIYNNGTSGTGNTYDVQTTNTCLVANTYNNVVVSISAGVASIYVNNILQPLTINENTSTSSYSSTFNFSISSRNAVDRFYNGLIDEVIIESRAWTPAEVSTYYRKSMLNYGFIGKNKGWLSNLLTTRNSNFFAFFN